MLKFLPYRFFAFLLASLIMVGCCEDTDLNLDPTLTKSWLPYQPQQNILFRGESGDTISFIATVRRFNQQSSDQACGTYSVQTEEATLASPSDPSLRLHFSVSHQMVLNLKVLYLNPDKIILEAKFNTVSEEYITHAWRDTFFKNYQNNGKKYHHVLQVYANPFPGILAISEIWYAKEVGLISFKTLAGGWYHQI